MGTARNSFKKDDEGEEIDDVQYELLEDEDAVVEHGIGNDVIEIDSNDNFSDSEPDSDSDSDYELEAADAAEDSNYDDDDDDTASVRSLRVGREKQDSQDDVLKLLKNSANNKKFQPPDILHDSTATTISFSPTHDIIAVGNIEGDICLYSYDIEKTEISLKYPAHVGNCRQIEYDEEGELIYSVSDDKCIIIADANSGKFKGAFDNAHDHPIYSLIIVNNNLFCTGDDDGNVKLWDRRKREEIFSLKIGTDYVSSLKCLDESSTLVCTAGDGIITAINTNTRKIISKSQPYDAELTCSDLFYSNTKLAVGTTTGTLLLYSWGQFSSWNDEFPGLDDKKHAINCMKPVTENIVITGLDNGSLRATNLFPMRHVGIVGQHGNTVECLDINKDGTLLASCSIDKKIRFWNVEYFEDIQITDKIATNNHKAREHNLPSSYGVNSTDFFAGLS